MRRTDQAILRADLVEKSERRCVAGQQQMIAVVDRHIERGIVIGAAAAAGLVGGLVHGDVNARRAQACCCCKTGQSRADDVDRSDHQNA